MPRICKMIDGKLVEFAGGNIERDNLRPRFEILTQSQYNSLAEAKALDKTKEIKRIKCEHCGASLNLDKITDNGLCKCEYCRMSNYVW